MKKTVLTMVACAVLLGIVAGARQSAANPLCRTFTQRLGFTPTGVVTADGVLLRRSTQTGRYETDAGLDFDVRGVDVEAVNDPQAACTHTASMVTLTVTDPFTGATSTVQAVMP